MAQRPQAPPAGPAATPRRRLPWASVVMTAVIVTALMIPGPDLPKVGFNGIDLLVHLCLFGAWGAAVQWEWAPRWWQQLLLGAAFAVGTETLQTLAVQRTFSVSDIVADFVGVSLGAALAWAVRQRSRQAVEQR